MHFIKEKSLILMVDGDVDFLDSTVSMLRKEFGKKNVMGTAHPEQATSWLQKSKHALLITEAELPGLNGLDFVNQALSIDRNLPVIMTTSIPPQQLRNEAEYSEFRLLQKPFSFSTLNTTIREAIKTYGTRLPRPPDWARKPTSPGGHRKIEMVSATPVTGSLKIVSISELIQLFASSTHQGKLWLTNDQGNVGCIYIDGNYITHIEHGGLVGPEAFRDFSTWHSGTFEWFTNMPKKQTMHISATDLLLQLHLAELTDVFDVKDSDKQLDINGLEGFSDAFEIFEVSDISGQGPEMSVFEQHDFTDSSSQNPVTPNPLPASDHPTGAVSMANNVQTILQSLTSINGFIAAALVDSDSGMALGTIGGSNNFNIEIAAATNAEVIKAKMRAIDSLKLDDSVEDILISLGTQYHLVRPLNDNPYIFLTAHKQTSPWHASP